MKRCGCLLEAQSLGGVGGESDKIRDYSPVMATSVRVRAKAGECRGGPSGTQQGVSLQSSVHITAIGTEL